MAQSCKLCHDLRSDIEYDMGHEMGHNIGHDPDILYHDLQLWYGIKESRSIVKQ